MKIVNVKDCPFAPTHIEGKKIRVILFNKIAIAF